MSALRLGRLPDGTRHIVEDPTFTEPVAVTRGEAVPLW